MTVEEGVSSSAGFQFFVDLCMQLLLMGTPVQRLGPENVLSHTTHSDRDALFFFKVRNSSRELRYVAAIQPLEAEILVFHRRSNSPWLRAIDETMHSHGC